MHHKTILSNGITFLTKEIPEVHSVSVNILVKTGSRNEIPELNGISHFLEHMAFKGTSKRSAKKIAEEFDAIGGYFNAYTGREHTVYVAKVLNNDFHIAIDILADILQNSAYNKEEIEKERSVILQEIAETNDNPDEIVYDYFQANAFKNQALGRPILGTPEIICNINRDVLVNHVSEHYSAENIIISCAGNVKHEYALELVTKLFSNIPKSTSNHIETPIYTSDFQLIEKELEQVHIVLGFNGCSAVDDELYKLQLLSLIYGGSMSSRLFQEIREERALAYSIGTFNSCYKDVGTFGVYASAVPENIIELLDVTMTELKKLSYDIKEEEIDRAKVQFKASFAMASESSSFLSEELAKNYAIFGRHVTHEEILEKIGKVTKDDLHNLVNNMLIKQQPNFAAIGHISLLENYDLV